VKTSYWKLFFWKNSEAAEEIYRTIRLSENIHFDDYVKSGDRATTISLMPAK
jgi:hypothetical protein